MARVEGCGRGKMDVPDLHEPRADPFHHFSPRRQPLLPVRLPLEQVAGMQRVRTELKHTTELTRRRRGPETELLHQRSLFAHNQALELRVECGKARVVLNGVETSVVALIALVFPDVHWCGLGVSRAMSPDAWPTHQKCHNLPLPFSSCRPG